MAQVDCIFDITVPTGGDLKGSMFGPVNGSPNRTGKMDKHNGNGNPPDHLVITVRWLAGAPVPQDLTGHVVFSQAPTAAASQFSASPFKKNSGGQICHESKSDHVRSTTPPSFQFGPYNLKKQGQPNESEEGKYELTFVVEDVSGGAGNEIQWSEDPEFDVGG